MNESQYFRTEIHLYFTLHVLQRNQMDANTQIEHNSLSECVCVSTVYTNNQKQLNNLFHPSLTFYMNICLFLYLTPHPLTLSSSVFFFILEQLHLDDTRLGILG